MRTGRRWGFELRLLVLTKGRWQWDDHCSNAASTTAVTVPGPSKTWPRLPASGPRSALVQCQRPKLSSKSDLRNHQAIIQIIYNRGCMIA